MTKAQFLSELRQRLSDLPYADQKRSLDYYSEMIDDRVEDGLSEEDAVKRIGSPAAAATQIMQDMPITTLARARMGRSHSSFVTVLIILSSPIWISLLAVYFSLIVTAIAVLFSLLAVLISLIVTFWAVEFSFAVCALGGTAAGILSIVMEQNIMTGLLLLGAALILFALTVFGYYAARCLTKGLILLCGWILKAYKLIFRFIKFTLIRKEAIR